MASKAARGDALVGEVGRLPARGDVAGLAVVAHRNMGGVLAGGDGAVVARRATIKDAIMRESCGLPRLCGVANIAILPGNNMRRALACRLHIVMAAAATA